MLDILTVIAVAAAIGAIELPSLIRKKWIKECVLLIAILVCGTVSSIAAVQLVEIKDPLKLLDIVYGPISDRIFQFIEQR